MNSARFGAADNWMATNENINYTKLWTHQRLVLSELVKETRKRATKMNVLSQRDSRHFSVDFNNCRDESEKKMKKL